MKPAKSMRPPVAGSPARNTVIFTTSPKVRPMDFDRLLQARQHRERLTCFVLPQYCGEFCGAFGSAGCGVRPLWNTRR